MKISKINLFGITMMPILSGIIVVISGFLNNASKLEITKTGILTLILTAAVVFYIRMQKDNILSRKYAHSILLISYILSILLILLPIKPDIFSFWMLGGFIVSLLIDNKLGLIIYFNLTFIICISLSLQLEDIIRFLVLGILMYILSGALKNKSTVIYASIIMLSTNITLAFIINNFIFEKSMNYNYLSSFFSILAVLVTAFLLSMLYERKLTKSKTEQIDKAELLGNPEIADCYALEGDTTDTKAVEESTATGLLTDTDKVQSNITEVGQPLIYPDCGARTSYELLCADDNVLLKRIKEYSEALYQHSVMIGDISERAASLIGADAILAKAGGLYHEVGKIIGKDYIEEGQKIAEEYAFPNALKEILRQHNIKHEKPASVEAAIVMLTDNVLSTVEYIRKTGDNKFTSDKIIDNIFQMRMDKGTFDDSSLSVKDYKALKVFYQNEYRK
ncbi:MAG TPA: HD domain-containing protein [Mobilitalea sp.]|nr:HD domain-containing protein [Mobilitalea sp.]